MSDPVKTVEDVEDVLSSIRRLVSETSSETRAEQRSDDAADSADDTPQGAPASDALILTSALRINEPTPADTADAPTELDSLRKAVSGGFDAPDVAEDAELGVFPDTDAETSNVAAWPVATPPEDYYEDEADQGLSTVVPWVAQDEVVAELQEPEPENFVFEEDMLEVEEDLPEEGLAEAELSDGDLSEQNATVEHLADESWDEDDPFKDVDAADVLDPGDEISPEDATHLAEATAQEPWISVTDYKDVAELADDTPETPDFADEMLDALTEDTLTDDPLPDDAEIVEEDADDDFAEDEDAPVMATFVRSGGDDAQRATVEDAELAGTEDADDVAMFAADDDDGDDGDAAKAADPIDLGNLDEGVIDEDMLHDLVAEIVRQELTGAMGERITRNVRKLVRREIHRALAAREFD